MITPGMAKAIELLHEYGDRYDSLVVKGPTRMTKFGAEINAGVAARLLKAKLVELHEWADGAVTLMLCDDIETQRLVAEVLDLPLCLMCELPTDDEESPYCAECWQEMRP